MAYNIHLTQYNFLATTPSVNTASFHPYISSSMNLNHQVFLDTKHLQQNKQQRNNLFSFSLMTIQTEKCLYNNREKELVCPSAKGKKLSPSSGDIKRIQVVLSSILSKHRQLRILEKYVPYHIYYSLHVTGLSSKLNLFPQMYLH